MDVDLLFSFFHQNFPHCSLGGGGGGFTLVDGRGAAGGGGQGGSVQSGGTGGSLTTGGYTINYPNDPSYNGSAVSTL